MPTNKEGHVLRGHQALYIKGELIEPNYSEAIGTHAACHAADSVACN